MCLKYHVFCLSDVLIAMWVCCAAEMPRPIGTGESNSPCLPCQYHDQLADAKLRAAFSSYDHDHLMMTAHEYLQKASDPLVEFLGLAKISKFAEAILGSFVFFTVIHLLVAPAVSQKFFPDAYAKGGKRGMNNW